MTRREKFVCLSAILRNILLIVGFILFLIVYDNKNNISSKEIMDSLKISTKMAASGGFSIVALLVEIIRGLIISLFPTSD